MKIVDLRKKSDKELEEVLKKEHARLASFHFQSAKGRSKNVKSAKTSRQTIARILTLFKEKQHGEE